MAQSAGLAAVSPTITPEHSDRPALDGLNQTRSLLRRPRPIPPPLDLTLKNVDEVEDQIAGLSQVVVVQSASLSPFVQKHLPLRKRAFSWTKLDGGAENEEEVEECQSSSPGAAEDNIAPPTTPSRESVIRSIPATVNGVSSSGPSRSCSKAIKFSIASLGLEELLTPSSVSSRASVSAASSAEALPSPHRRRSTSPPSPLDLSQGTPSSSHTLVSASSTSSGVFLPHSHYPPPPFPRPAWCCFLPGTKLSFLTPVGKGNGLRECEQQYKSWTTVEDIANGIVLPPRFQVGRAFQVGRIEFVTSSPTPFALIEFYGPSTSAGRSASPATVPLFTAACAMEHPFFVPDRGEWCSLSPDLTRQMFFALKPSIFGGELKTGDWVLRTVSAEPPSGLTPDLDARLRVFTFPSPLSVKHDHHQHLSGGTALPSSAPATGRFAGGVLSPPDSPGTPSGDEKAKGSREPRTKRPMNGFMLFAKEFRQEMIYTNPGRDNRSISILLGEAWKKLTQEQREDYSRKARDLAEEYKKDHPDCWKRRKSMAGGSMRKNQSPSLATSSVLTASMLNRSGNTSAPPLLAHSMLTPHFPF